MAYHDLSECSLTAEERRQEASRIFNILYDYMDQLTQKERNFIESINYEDSIPVSVKQLFWLRDIKDKYL